MATSGSFNTTSSDGRYLTFSWQEVSQSIANNTTTISYKVVGAGNNGYVVCGKFKLNIDGATVYSSATRIRVYPGTVICSGTLTLEHNSAGEKTFSAYLEAAIYYTAVNCSGSGSYALDAIARASIPTLSASTFALGEQVRINTNAAVASFTHDIYYSWNYAGWNLISSGVSGYALWTPPLSFANNIPNAASGPGQIRVETFSGDTLIGIRTINFTATVPDSVKPTCSVAITDATGALADLGFLVEDVSQLNVDITAAGVFGSDIASYNTTVSLACNNQTYTSAYNEQAFTTPVVPAHGTLTLTTVVTDSRGHQSDPFTVEYTVEGYSPPILNTFDAFRSDESGTRDDEGDYITIQYNASLAPLQYRNTWQFEFKIEALDGSGDSISGNITRHEGEYETGTWSLTRGASGNTSHAVTFTIEDRYTTTERKTTVSSAFTLINWGADGKSMAIGKVAEKERTFEVALDMETTGSLTQLGNHTVASLPGTAGTTGYILAASFQVNQQTLPSTSGGLLAPFKIVLASRSTHTLMTLSLQIRVRYGFTSLYYFEYEGANYSPVVVPQDDGITFDLYVPKKEGNDGVSILEWRMPKELEGIIKMTFPGTQVSQLPDVEPIYSPAPAALDSLVDLIYPVGSIYMSTRSKSPESLFGGSWVQLEDRFLLGAGSTYAAGATGGAATHTLTTSEIPAHTHPYQSAPLTFAERDTSGNNCIDPYNSGNTCRQVTRTSASTGSGGAHNNMPPYLVVYMWRRTA